VATVQKKRRLKSDERRALIVAAAAAEFGRRGPRDMRMEDIAAAAGVTKAVVYDHFKSKDELHAEVLARASDDLVTYVTEAIFEFETPKDRFRAALRATFEIVARRPDIRALLLGQEGPDPKVHRAAVKAHHTARRAIATLYLTNPLFLRGRRDRERRAEHVAQAGMGAINALVALGIEQKLDPDYLADLAIAVLDPGMAVMAGEAPAPA
jgi:AcrR family transcriptional regulator